MGLIFSPAGRVNPQQFFLIMVAVAVVEAVGLRSWRYWFGSGPEFYLMVAVCAWVQICAIVKRLKDAGWTQAMAAPMIPACFWPLWSLLRIEISPLWQLLSNMLAIYAAVFVLLLCVKKGAVPKKTVPEKAVEKPITVKVGPPTDAMPPAPEFDPVVGWLVAIEGPCRGQQYRLRARRNRIGSDAAMEVQISSPRIEKLEHAAITYDPRENRYIVTAGSGLVAMRSQAMLQPLVQPATLQPYDRICLGDTTLIFVPLCGPHHKWQLKAVW